MTQAQQQLRNELKEELGRRLHELGERPPHIDPLICAIQELVWKLDLLAKQMDAPAYTRNPVHQTEFNRTRFVSHWPNHH